MISPIPRESPGSVPWVPGLRKGCNRTLKEHPSYLHVCSRLKGDTWSLQRFVNLGNTVELGLLWGPLGDLCLSQPFSN